MKYVNLQAGLKIDLSGLNEAEKKFYIRALKEFEKNVDWLDFDHFVLGKHSTLYDGKRSHLDVLKHPLYLALKDMWLRLGIQQGMIAGRVSHRKEALV